MQAFKGPKKLQKEENPFFLVEKEKPPITPFIESPVIEENRLLQETKKLEQKARAEWEAAVKREAERLKKKKPAKKPEKKVVHVLVKKKGKGYGKIQKEKDPPPKD